jgi:hypothetical protein
MICTASPRRSSIPSTAWSAPERLTESELKSSRRSLFPKTLTLRELSGESVTGPRCRDLIEPERESFSDSSESRYVPWHTFRDPKSATHVEVDNLHASAVECLHLMVEKNQYKNRIELLQGTLDMLILKTLQWGPQHGYGIVQALRVGSRE